MLATLTHIKLFQIVAVDDKRAQVAPQEGTGAPRYVLRERIEHIATLGIQREELCKRVREEYDDEMNASYIAAIVCEVTK